MATTMVAEKEGSARPKTLMAKILEAVVAILGLSSGCFIMGFACAHLRLKVFFGQPPRPYHSVLVFNTIFPHFATWRSEIGDRDKDSTVRGAEIGDRIRATTGPGSEIRHRTRV